MIRATHLIKRRNDQLIQTKGEKGWKCCISFSRNQTKRSMKGFFNLSELKRHHGGGKQEPLLDDRMEEGVSQSFGEKKKEKRRIFSRYETKYIESC